MLRFAATPFAFAAAAILMPAAMAGDTSPYITALKQIQQEMVETWIEIRNFTPNAPYCLPPYAPLKQVDQMLIDAFAARTQALNARFLATRQSLIDFLNTNTHLQGELMVDGLTPVDGAWWEATTYERERKRMLRGFNEKSAAVKNGRERQCATSQPPAETIGEVFPPAPTGPGIELPKVEKRRIGGPIRPADDKICDEEYRQQLLAAYQRAAWDVYMNYQDAREYAGAIAEALRTGQGNAPVLRQMLPDAEAATKARAAELDAFMAEYDRVRTQPLDDCGPPPAREAVMIGGESIAFPAYEAVGDPAMPDRFCSPEEKAAALRSARAARDTADRNYNRATDAFVKAARKVNRGLPPSAPEQAAFDRLSAESESWLKKAQAWEEVVRAIEAKPHEKCDTPATGTKTGYLRGPGAGLGAGYEVALRPRLSFLGREAVGAAAPTLGLVPTDRSFTGAAVTASLTLPLFDGFNPEIAVSHFEGSTETRIDRIDLGGDRLVVPGLGVGENGNGYVLGYFGGLNTPSAIRAARDYEAWGVAVSDPYAWQVSGAEDDEGADVYIGPRIGYRNETDDAAVDAEVAGFGRRIRLTETTDADIYSAGLDVTIEVPVYDPAELILGFRLSGGVQFTEADGEARLAFTGFADQVITDETDDTSFEGGISAYLQAQPEENLNVLLTTNYHQGKAVVWDAPGGGARAELKTEDASAWQIVFGVALRW